MTITALVAITWSRGPEYGRIVAIRLQLRGPLKRLPVATDDCHGVPDDITIVANHKTGTGNSFRSTRSTIIEPEGQKISLCGNFLFAFLFEWIIPDLDHRNHCVCAVGVGATTPKRSGSGHFGLAQATFQGFDL